MDKFNRITLFKFGLYMIMYLKYFILVSKSILSCGYLEGIWYNEKNIYHKTQRNIRHAGDAGDAGDAGGGEDAGDAGGGEDAIYIWGQFIDIESY
jgi:hypothetical protein